MTADDAISFLCHGATEAASKTSGLVQSLVEEGMRDGAKVELILCAIEAFDSEPAAYQWLTSPNMLLREESPLQVMATGNIEHVRRLLAAINYGGVA